MEALFTILSGLIMFNNRATEAFKMYLRDKTSVGDESRRILTVVFSMVVGVGSVAVMQFGGVEFSRTELAPFADNPALLAIVGGAMVSFGGAMFEPILEILGAVGKLADSRNTQGDGQQTSA